jgi:hypothetical protein
VQKNDGRLDAGHVVMDRDDVQAVRAQRFGNQKGAVS